MDGQDVKKEIECPVCGGPMRRVGDAAYYDQVSRWRTPVYYCEACDLFYREVEERRLISHFQAAGCLREENEEGLSRSRIGFFRWTLGRHVLTPGMIVIATVDTDDESPAGARPASPAAGK